MRIPSLLRHVSPLCVLLVSSSLVSASAKHSGTGHATYLRRQAIQDAYIHGSHHQQENGTTTLKTAGSLQQRDGGSRFTYYDTGLNACGSYDKNSDYIVALNAEQWDNGAHCYQDIIIDRNGKTTHAKVTDLCPSCPYGALDLSPGLFGDLAPLDLGVIYGNWVFVTKKIVSAKPTEAAESTEVLIVHKSTPTKSNSKVKSIVSSKHFSTIGSASKLATSAAHTSTFRKVKSPILVDGMPIAETVAAAPTASPSMTAGSSGFLEELNIAIVRMGMLINTEGQASNAMNDPQSVRR